MPSFKVEGIVLNRKNFGEADRILTVFTQQKGKISVVAKGVRRTTSRRAGNVELLNRVSMFLYQGKGLPILTEAESLETFSKLKEDLTLSAYAFHIIELVNKMTVEDQENRILYQYLLEVLHRLSVRPRQILIRAFEVKILSYLGFISFQPFKPGLQVRFQTGFAGSILEKLEILGWDQIEKTEINEKEALELERVLRYHLERVIEGKLKSRGLLRKLSGWIT